LKIKTYACAGTYLVVVEDSTSNKTYNCECALSAVPQTHPLAKMNYFGASKTTVAIECISIDGKRDALTVTSASPRLSWSCSNPDSVRKWKQISYEVQLKTVGDVHSRHLEGDNSVVVPWPFEPLVWGGELRIRCLGQAGSDEPSVTAWYPWTKIKCTLLRPTNEFVAHPYYQARFITPVTQDTNANPLRPIRFRKEFCCHNMYVHPPMLYITSCGIYTVYINGICNGDHEMAPGWSSYEHRHAVQTLYIPTKVLNPDRNVVEIEVAEGWWAGNLGWANQRSFWGQQLAVLARLSLLYNQGNDYADIVTDETWECYPSPIISSGIYAGEVYDARLENDQWYKASDAETVDTAPWAPVKILEKSMSNLQASNAPPVRVTEKLAPVEKLHSPLGKTILDFGQNLVGKVHIPKLD